MKNKIKVILFSVIAVISVLLIFVLIKIGPMLTMCPLHTGVINEMDSDCQITAFKLGNNDLFFIADDDKYIVVDTGINANVVSQILESHEVNPDNVTDVLLTHNHFDHVNGLSVFKNAIVHIGDDDAVAIFAKNIHKLSDGVVINTKTHEIKCIALPGHTKGSMGFLVDDKYLFIGDAAKIRHNRFAIHPYTTDQDTAKSSIEKINEYYKNGIVVISAHYGMLNWKK